MNEQDPLAQKIKKTLDQQALSDETSRALRAARMAALDSGSSQSRQPWKPVVAVASVAMLIAGILIYGFPDEVGFPEENIEDLVVIVSEDELDFYQDLEFYYWLEEDQGA